MVYVFKTSVKTKQAVEKLTPYLSKLLSSCEWNFDLQDCDKIFRFQSEKDISQILVSLLQEHGFQCEELPD